MLFLTSPIRGDLKSILTSLAQAVPPAKGIVVGIAVLLAVRVFAFPSRFPWTFLIKVIGSKGCESEP